MRETDAEFLRRHPEFMNYLQWPGPELSIEHVSGDGSGPDDSDSEDTNINESGSKSSGSNESCSQRHWQQR